MNLIHWINIINLMINKIKKIKKYLIKNTKTLNKIKT